jgi:hypothetical protein
MNWIGNKSEKYDFSILISARKTSCRGFSISSKKIFSCGIGKNIKINGKREPVTLLVSTMVLKNERISQSSVKSWMSFCNLRCCKQNHNYHAQWLYYITRPSVADPGWNIPDPGSGSVHFSTPDRSEHFSPGVYIVWGIKNRNYVKDIGTDPDPQ